MQNKMNYRGCVHLIHKSIKILPLHKQNMKCVCVCVCAHTRVSIHERGRKESDPDTQII